MKSGDPMCLSCKYLIEDAYKRDTYYCKAFPGGIPDRIFYDGYDHRQPYAGDRGIRYESIEDELSDRR